MAPRTPISERNITAWSILSGVARDCASDRRTRMNAKQGEQKIISQAFALPQRLLNAGDWLCRLDSGPQESRFRMSHPCVAFSRRTRLKHKIQEIGEWVSFR